jgi:nitrite reductase/ring-hydroxylating ferredoxin subunit
VKGEQIALFNVDSQFFALDNTCSSRSTTPALTAAGLADGEVTCPGTAPHSTFGRAKS